MGIFWDGDHGEIRYVLGSEISSQNVFRETGNSIRYEPHLALHMCFFAKSKKTLGFPANLYQTNHGKKLRHLKPWKF